MPPADLLPERLDALLAVIYLIFNEGYVATGGATATSGALTRSDLCGEAIRLGRVLVALMPQSAEAHGLLALMLLHDSRREARLNAAGELVLLDEQDRSRWDQAKIREGAAILDRSDRSATIRDPIRCRPRSARCTPKHRHAEATDWRQIAALYDTLARMTPSMVVEVNRAVAVAMAYGAAGGIADAATTSRIRRTAIIPITRRAPICCGATANARPPPKLTNERSLCAATAPSAPTFNDGALSC